MTAGIASVQVKRRQGHLCVLATGQTPRGQRVLRKMVMLECKTPSDPAFKAQLAAAIKEIYTQSPSPS